MVPKKSVYVKRYDGQTKWMYFLIGDGNLSETYNTIWDKFSANMKKRKLITSLSTIKNILKKCNGDKVTEFQDKKIPKVGSNHTCLVLFILDFVVKKNESFYPQVFLKECKYIEKKIIRHNHDNLSVFSSSFSEKSDEE